MKTRAGLLFVYCLAVAVPAGATQGSGVAARGANDSRSGAVVFEKVRPSLVTLRNALVSTGERSTLGSAFAVDRQGRAITNYHVVAEHALRPERYALEYESASGPWRRAQVLAIDVVHDLAVIQLEQFAGGPIPLFAGPSKPSMRLGEPIFSLGNPLDLGFTVTAGTYSGMVRGGHGATVHFTGALNAGMSGGPALNACGDLVGVNVSRMADGEQVSFLVPIEHAQDLYRRATAEPAIDLRKVRDVIASQIGSEQARISALALGRTWTAGAGRALSVPEMLDDAVECAAQDNDQGRFSMPYEFRSLQCAMRNMIYVDEGFYASGVVYASHVLRAKTLNTVQLFRAADRVAKSELLGLRSRHYARQVCTESFIDLRGRPGRAVVCAQAFRELQGLYEIEVRVISQNGESEVTVSRLALNGFTWDNGMALVSRYMDWMR